MGNIIYHRTSRGFRYTCNCGEPDIVVDRFEDVWCASCDAWRAWPTKEQIQSVKVNMKVVA